MDTGVFSLGLSSAVSAFYMATIYMVSGLGVHGRLAGNTARTSDPR